MRAFLARVGHATGRWGGMRSLETRECFYLSGLVYYSDARGEVVCLVASMNEFKEPRATPRAAVVGRNVHT